MLGIGSLVDSHRGFLPDARCGAVEAVAAGLGQIGKSGALLTPEFGPHQRQIVFITDAVLPADSVYQGKTLCHVCHTCVNQCPMSALGKGEITLRVDDQIIRIPSIDRHRCDWSKKYALCREEGPEMIGNKTNVANPQGPITIETIAEAMPGRDPIMKRRPCILETCLRQCPADPR
jgi:ferredoxin